MRSLINISTKNKNSLTSLRLLVVAALLISFLFVGCDKQSESQNKNVVVVYTALDAVHSEPVFKLFEKKTGIKVLPVYDTEAAKTTGLVSRLIVRRDQPDCDVFWNNEIIQTERLAQLGILEPYSSPQASRFPQQFRDPNNYWTGFAARMRLIIYNTDKIDRQYVPKTLEQLVSDQYQGQVAIARPFFGTTLTHMVILQQLWPDDRFNKFLNDIIQNNVALCAGNGQVRDLVAAGEKIVGLTDTDDAYAAILDGKPVDVLIPDADTGAILIPNTVALIANAPHKDNARQLIDFLLSPEVERYLAAGPSAQIPLADDLQQIKTPWSDTLTGKPAQWDIQSAAKTIESVIAQMQQLGLDQ